MHSPKPLPEHLTQHAARFWSGVDKTGECWTWTRYIGSDGYGAIGINGKPFKAHRVAFALSIGEIPDGMIVCHRCDNRLCVRPDHLFAGSVGDNNRDCAAKGRRQRLFGATNGRARLTPAQVALLRSSPRYQAPALALQFGVSKSAAYRARRGGTWSVDQASQAVAS